MGLTSGFQNGGAVGSGTPDPTLSTYPCRGLTGASESPQSPGSHAGLSKTLRARDPTSSFSEAQARSPAATRQLEGNHEASRQRPRLPPRTLGNNGDHMGWG